jgi:putative intracellular protease/amidase
MGAAWQAHRPKSAAARVVQVARDPVAKGREYWNMASRKMKVLVVASNYGFWGEELQAPWDALVNAGHEAVLATPRGKKPLPLKISVDPDFVDPVQNYNVNPPEVCDRVKELANSRVWNTPLRLCDVNMSDYDAIALAGGLGADLDLINNPALHDLLREAVHSNKLTAAMCFAVGSLVLTREPHDHYRSIVYGKQITAHPREWDFRADVTYELWNPTSDNRGTDLVSPGFVVCLQDIAEDAVGPSGRVFSDPRTSRGQPNVVYDWPLITACSVESSIAYGQKIVEILDAH